MHKMMELREMLVKELDECAKKDELSANSLDIIDKLTHSIKSIDTIMAMENATSGEYNRSYNARQRDSRGRYMDGYNRTQYGGDYGNDYGRMYGDDYSRDEYGRYGEDYNRGYNRYSRDEAKNALMENLRQMERSAKDEEQRTMIRKWISQAEK